MDNIEGGGDVLNGVAYHDDNTQVILVSAKKSYSAAEGLDITGEYGQRKVGDSAG